jgi:hypothetical protein
MLLHITTEMLWNLFNQLGFYVIWHENCNARNMKAYVKEDIEKNNVHKMLVCCISSHGRQGAVKGQDGEILMIRELIDDVASLDSPETAKLKDKPKLFFINACQGSFRQKGLYHGSF